MPVITPAYPSMCATFNITRSSMTIIKRELQRGLKITEDIMMGKRPWSDLFVKHTFFTSGYKYYISVTTASKSKESHKIWSGYVESKVRMLVQKLEQHPSIALAHAFNKGYDRRHRCNNEDEVAQVQDGSLEFLIKDEADDGNVTNEGDGVAIKDEKGVSVKPEEGIAMKSLEDIPIKSEHDAAVKTENAADDETDKITFPIDVYTTTHYIGLELAEGRIDA